MLSPFKAPFSPMVIPIRLTSEAPPSEDLGSQGVYTQVLIISEAPMLSPFRYPLASTKDPTAAKRERLALPTYSDVGPESKRFAVATNEDDADVSERLWNLRALKVDRSPST
jgi:hypothetical protein